MHSAPCHYRDVAPEGPDAVNLAGPKIRAARQARQEAMGEVSGLLGEAFAAVASIKAAGAEEHVTRRLDQLNQVRRRATLRDVFVEQLLGSIASNTAALATGVLLLLSGESARTGRFTVGDFALFTSYLAWLGTVVSYAGHTFTSFRPSETSIARIAEVLQGAPATDLVAHRPVHLRGPLPAFPPYAKSPEDRLERLDVRGLTFVHPGSGRGVCDVDLHIERGEFVAVTGRLGSGKTTLWRAVLGLLPPDAGEICWNGIPVEEPGAFLVPPRCAYTPQVPRLFSAALRDNVLLGLEPSGQALEHAAHAAVLERDLPRLESGWATLVGPRGLKLSGGQVQRTVIARMFVRDAELLVMDDLSSALDVETERL